MNLLTTATDDNSEPEPGNTAGANETVLPAGIRLEQLLDGIAQVLRAPAPTSDDGPQSPVSPIRAVAERALVAALQAGLKGMAGDVRRELLKVAENLRAIEHLAGLGDDELLAQLLQQPQERRLTQAPPRMREQPESSEVLALFAPAFQPENSGLEAAPFEVVEDQPEPERTEEASDSLIPLPDEETSVALIPLPDEETPETPVHRQSSGVEPDLGPVPREQVRLLLRRAEALWRHGDDQGALAACSRAIALSPQWAGGYLARGQIYRLRGQSTPACVDFAEAIRLRPDHAEAWLRRGVIYQETGAWEEAAHDYSAALAVNPRLTTAYVNRALVRARQGDWADAVEDASAALELDPDCSDAFFIRGSAFLHQGEYALALDDLSELLQREPENFLALNERGLVYARLGDFPSALEDYEQALRLKPQFLQARFNRAVALSSSGAIDRALAAFNRLIALQPGRAVLYYHRGRVRLARNEPKPAGEDFERALAIQENFTEAAEGLEEERALLDPEEAVFSQLTATEEPAEPTENTPASISPPAPRKSASNDAKTTDAATAAADTLDKSKQVNITLTCLNCQATSKIQIGMLGKRFQCPRCQHVHGVTARGELKQILPPRTRREKYKGWILQFGLRAAVLVAVVMLLGGGIWYARRLAGPKASLPPLPDELEPRAELMAKAWYTGDSELVRRLTHGPQGRHLKSWMRDHQPPTSGKILSLAEKQQIQVEVHIGEEKNDSARLQLKITHPLSPPATLDLHWVRSQDAWCFQPFPEKDIGRTSRSAR